MSFIRNIDPVESMKIGRRESSIEIVGVTFTIDESKMAPQTPEFIYNFLKRFEKIEFPDPLFYPHNIRLVKIIEVEDHTIDQLIQYSKMMGAPQLSSGAILNKMTKKEEIRLRDFAGKTIIFSGQFLLMPSIESIQEKAPWLIKDEEKEDERIINEQLMRMKRDEAMMKMFHEEVQSKKRIEEAKYQAEKVRHEIIKNSTFKLKDFKSILPF